jgi:hypothetical protein
MKRIIFYQMHISMSTRKSLQYISLKLLILIVIVLCYFDSICLNCQNTSVNKCKKVNNYQLCIHYEELVCGHAPCDVLFSLVPCLSKHDSHGTAHCSPHQPVQRLPHLPPAVPTRHPQIWPPDGCNHRHMLAAFGHKWPQSLSDWQTGWLNNWLTKWLS